MNKKLKSVIVLSLLFATSFLVFIPTTSSAALPTHYVAITLSNSQSTATPKNFTQMLKINWSNYSSYLNANVSNVRFYNSTTFTSANELAGWIETNNTTTTTSSTVWVNLSGNIVPASGSVIIYMTFLPITASWSSHWGLAPTLSTKYGQFDNGAKVFEFYDNFAGTTLNTNKWTSNLGSGGTITVSNGLTISSTTNYDTFVQSVNTFSNPSVFETSVTASLPTTDYERAALFIGTGSTSDENVVSYGYTFEEVYVNGQKIQISSSSANKEIGTTTSLSGILGGIWISSGNEQLYYNYQNILTWDDTTQTFGASHLGLDVAGVSGGYSATFHWARIRVYPPDNVMPSITFGSVTRVITPSGYQISFQQTSLPSGTKWGIRLNNTTAVIWQNSTTSYDNITSLHSGNYTYQVINATGYASNPYTGIITIVSTNLTQLITFTGYQITYNESGLPSGDTWYVNLTNQPGLSESLIGQKLSGTTTSLTNYEPNDTYTFTYQTSNKKYSGGTASFTVNGASVTENVKFTEVLYYLNFTPLSKPKLLEWGVNVSGTIKTGYGNFSYHLPNGTYYWNASAINGSFNNPIGWWRLTNGAGTVLLHNESSFKGVKIVINGKNYNDNVTFNRAYNISFEEVGIANTFQWDVNLSNGLGTTLDKYIIISDNITQIYFNSTEGNYINGSYSGTIQTLIYGATDVRYINFTSQSISETINGTNIVIVYNFLTQYYLTTISNPVNGGYHSPYSGWYNASTKVQISANSNSSYQFTGFQGKNTSSYTGLGYYSSGDYLASIIMTNPITEIMDFNNYIVLTFFMQNITTDTKWGIKLFESNNMLQWTNVTNSSYIAMDLAKGTYTYLVTGVQSTPQTNTILISVSTEVLLQYNISTYDVNFKENGLPPGTNWAIAVFATTYSLTVSGSSSILNFELPNGSFSYLSKSVYGYVTNNSSGSFNVSGIKQTIYINWTEGNDFILEGIRDFVQLTINTTDYSISAGTQIPITMNWKKYASYENSNLSNVLFMNSTFYPLYAWIETGASSSSTNSQVWVKIAQNISAYSSLSIYVTWQTKNRNNLNKYGYLGEAPQLSQQYGEWNNIAEVMDPGLLEQLYVNNTNAHNISLAGPILNASFSKGTTIDDRENYKSLTSYFLTSQQGSTREIYQDTPGNGYGPYSQENNVLISYQGVTGSIGTWISPPITSSTQGFVGKAQGFVEMDQKQTDWYMLDDDGRYLRITNGTTGSYLNNNWTSNGTLISVLGGSGVVDSPTTATSYLQGTARISMLYYQYNAEALWQVWTNYPVQFWHPVPMQSFNSSSQISFGPVLSSQNSFYEYGLPANTNWSIAISGPGISKLYTSDSNVIYTYLPNGTYIYTVGSMVNGSYHSGLANVGNTHYVPTPSNGHVIVTGGAFTVQYIVFAKNDLLEYDLIPGQAQYSNGSLILPIFVLNQNNQPANTTVIKDIWQNMSLTYLARLQNQTETIPFTFSTSGLGMFAIFFSLNVREVKQIKSSNATLSMVSDFSKTAYYTGIATGIAGSASFVDVVVKGQNISSVSPPGVTNTTTNTTGVPWYIGLIANTYPTYSPNALIYLENIVIWILANAGGRALTLIVGLATLLYFAWIINKARKDKGDKKWKFRVEKKLDVVYRKILREPIKQKSNNETSES